MSRFGFFWHFRALNAMAPVFMRMLISAWTNEEPASWYAMRFGLPETESVCIFHPLGSEAPLDEMSLRLRCTHNTRGVGRVCPIAGRPWRVPCLIFRNARQGLLSAWTK